MCVSVWRWWRFALAHGKHQRFVLRVIAVSPRICALHMRGRFVPVHGTWFTLCAWAYVFVCVCVCRHQNAITPVCGAISLCGCARACTNIYGSAIINSISMCCCLRKNCSSLARHALVIRSRRRACVQHMHDFIHSHAVTHLHT